MTFRTFSRRLSYQTLEVRRCLSAVRIVTWNTANGPNNATEDQHFETVLNAISGKVSAGKVSAGNASPPAIIALQETDTTAFGNNSIARIEAIMESIVPSSDYRRAASPLDSGDDANGFVYDAAVVDLVASQVVPRLPGMQAFAHNNLRARFRPVGTAGQSDFYVYSVHLKAGSSATDASRRTSEAAAIRSDIDSLGANQNVLVMGDFNVSGSSEGAYQNLIANGNGQLLDPINRPGEWKNNGAFRDIHTQNPQVGGPGGMDDRFDIQLATSAVFDGQAFEYVAQSYHAFGNNGTHTLNSNITTGSGASQTVLAALAAASDHLPVVADYSFSNAPQGITITQSDATTTVREGGATDTYTIELDSIPSGPVTVTITADSQTLVDGSQSRTLTFTPDNALSPQLVTVTAVDDSLVEGTHLSALRHEIGGVDPDYTALTPITIQATVFDNDAPTVVISEIMYNPASSEPLGEWVEVANLGPGNVNVSGWQLDDEDSLDWAPLPPCTDSLEAGEVAIIHHSSIDSAVFRSQWGIPSSVKVIGVGWGSLANGPSSTSEVLELRDALGGLLDVVNYDDAGDWPTDNGRSSITLANLLADNNVGSNWSIAIDGIDGARQPAGAPFNPDDIGSPGIYPALPLPAPTVVDVIFDQESKSSQTNSQRSLVRSIDIVFDQPVTVDTTDFVLEQLQDGGVTEPVDITAEVVQIEAGTRAMLTFSGPLVDSQSGSLTDGNYRLTIVASNARSAFGGIQLDGDANASPGGDFIVGGAAEDNFFRLFGDSDGDRDVDALNYALFAAAFQSKLGDPNYNALFDVDVDGDIDAVDYARFAQNFLQRI